MNTNVSYFLLLPFISSSLSIQGGRQGVGGGGTQGVGGKVNNCFFATINLPESEGGKICFLALPLQPNRNQREGNNVF